MTRARIDSPRSSPHRCRVAPVVRCALWAAAARRIYRIRFLFELRAWGEESKKSRTTLENVVQHPSLRPSLVTHSHATESSQSGILSSRLYMYLRVRPLFSSLSGWAADVSASSLLRLAWKPCVREAARPSRARARLQCKQLPRADEKFANSWKKSPPPLAFVARLAALKIGTTTKDEYFPTAAFREWSDRRRIGQRERRQYQGLKWASPRARTRSRSLPRARCCLRESLEPQRS